MGVFATVHAPVSAKRQERARGRSLRQLLAVLDREGIDELIIESRGLQDVHDRRTILSAIQTGPCEPSITYRFDRKSEPLLWLPDAIAGLLSDAECGRTHRWIAVLQRCAQLVEIRRINT